MKAGARISVIIPALNEEAAIIGRVIAAIPVFVDDVVVADNGSTDGTGTWPPASGLGWSGSPGGVMAPLAWRGWPR